MTAESPRPQLPGAILKQTIREGESPNRLSSHSLPVTPDNVLDQPAYWTGWHDGRATGLDVGWERGYQAGLRANAEQLAHELLHEQAADVARVAAGEAVERHGPAWAWLLTNDETTTPDNTSKGMVA